MTEEGLVALVEDIIWQRTTLDHEWCENLAKTIVSAVMREIDGNFRTLED